MLNNQKIAPPATLMPWLTHTQALTDKLEAQTGESNLCVLRQACEGITWWDRYFLKLENGPVMHREILMSTHGTPCWYARSIYPEIMYQKNPQFFIRLEEKSLASLLFNNPKITRKTLLYYPITQQCIEYHWLDAFTLAKEPLLWTRFSIFLDVDNNVQFYLVEIFLPGLRKY